MSIGKRGILLAVCVTFLFSGMTRAEEAAPAAEGLQARMQERKGQLLEKAYQKRITEYATGTYQQYAQADDVFEIVADNFPIKAFVRPGTGAEK